MQSVLHGLKVLDFTRVYSGPYCTMLMADMGAEVVKIERSGSGDDSRNFYPVVKGESGYFYYLNRGKKSIALDLKAEADRRVALELAAWADVIVENFSPGTMSRLGLSYDDAVKVNPNVIYASISGYGQTGPDAQKAAYDGIIQVTSGLVSLTGFTDGPPVKVGPAISDAMSGIHALAAILAALYHRAETGEGQYIDISMMDTMFSVLENAVPVMSMKGECPKRMGNANPGSSPYNIYRASDGYISICTANNGLFAKLLDVMGKPDVIKDPRFCENHIRKENETAVDEIVEEWTMLHSCAEIESLLNTAKVPVGRVKSVEELMSDPQLLHRNMLVEHELPNFGKVNFPGDPLKFSKTPTEAGVRAPELGEHSRYVLEQLLGYTPEQLAKLRPDKYRIDNARKEE